MRMRSFLPLLLLFLLTSIGQAADLPNIILILADDLGWADTTLCGKTELYETPILPTRSGLD